MFKDTLIGSSEASTLLGFHPNYFWQLIKTNKLPLTVIKVGHRMKFKRSEVKR
jgi:excisionase family DNA binding protein